MEPNPIWVTAVDPSTEVYKTTISGSWVINIRLEFYFSSEIEQRCKEVSSGIKVEFALQLLNFGWREDVFNGTRLSSLKKNLYKDSDSYPYFPAFMHTNEQMLACTPD